LIADAIETPDDPIPTDGEEDDQDLVRYSPHDFLVPWWIIGEGE
jgi:hypothetical protein